MDIRDVLGSPLIYQTYQRAGGFFGARLRAIKACLPLKPGERIVDIGCGPGFIVECLPPGIIYSGYDTNAKYIEYATARFGGKGTFICNLFDSETARAHGPADVVMMNGLLHHLDDRELDATLAVIKEVLAPGGRVFTLDGCFANGQSSIARALLKSDRGKFVRNEEQYRSLMEKHFASVDVLIDHHLSWIPYTWIVMVGRTGGP
jgi:SAM-dependent methyltransferase